MKRKAKTRKKTQPKAAVTTRKTKQILLAEAEQAEEEQGVLRRFLKRQEEDARQLRHALGVEERQSSNLRMQLDELKLSHQKCPLLNYYQDIWEHYWRLVAVFRHPSNGKIEAEFMGYRQSFDDIASATGWLKARMNATWPRTGRLT